MTSKNLNAVAADSNVLLSAVIGKAALKIFTHTNIEVFTTNFNIEEIKEYIPHLAKKYHLNEQMLYSQLQMLPLIIKEKNFYKSKMKEASQYLQDRDADDIHLCALALKIKIPICSNDKDFVNLPVEVYPTAKLLKALGI